MTRLPMAVAVLLLALGCTSQPAGRTSSGASLPASPQFCEWAQAIIDSAPTVESTSVDQALDNDRLVLAAADLVRFADTLEGAASHAPTERQSDFSLLAGFNREVATVIVGELPLQDSLLEGATDAAQRIAETIDTECGLVFDPVDGLAFTGGG